MGTNQPHVEELVCYTPQSINKITLTPTQYQSLRLGGHCKVYNKHASPNCEYKTKIKRLNNVCTLFLVQMNMAQWNK